MAVSASFLEFILEQLGRIQPVSHRRMFGGIGLYANDHFFGLIDNDILYFKVDDSTRGDYETHGARPFQPFGEGTKPMTGYYEVPGDILESEPRLRAWMQAAVRVAESAKSGRKPKSAAPSRKAPKTRTSARTSAGEIKLRRRNAAQA